MNMGLDVGMHGVRKQRACIASAMRNSCRCGIDTKLNRACTDRCNSWTDAAMDTTARSSFQWFLIPSFR